MASSEEKQTQSEPHHLSLHETTEDRQMLIQTELRTLKRLFTDVSEVYSSLQTLLATLKNGA